MEGEPNRRPKPPLFRPYFLGCGLRCSNGRLGDSWCEWANKCPYGNSIGRSWFKRYNGRKLNGRG